VPVWGICWFFQIVGYTSQTTFDDILLVVIYFPSKTVQGDTHCWHCTLAHDKCDVLPSMMVPMVPMPNRGGSGDATNKTPNQTPVTGSMLLPVSAGEGL